MSVIWREAFPRFPKKANWWFTAVSGTGQAWLQAFSNAMDLPTFITCSAAFAHGKRWAFRWKKRNDRPGSLLQYPFCCLPCAMPQERRPWNAMIFFNEWFIGLTDGSPSLMPASGADK